MNCKKLNHRTASRLMFASITSLSVLSMSAGAAKAAPIISGLFATGVNAAGTGLQTQGLADPHYTLTVNLDSGNTAYVTNGNSSQLSGGAWGADTASSQWISPKPLYISGNTTSDPAGNYTYQTTFSLTGNTTGAIITGDYLVCNSLVQIDLNGNNVGVGLPSGNGNTKTLENFTINSGFVVGTNTLDFVVNNAGGQSTGIQVEQIGAVVPEPASLGLTGLAIAGLALRRRSKHATS